jgi:hypothetical protein
LGNSCPRKEVKEMEIAAATFVAAVIAALGGAVVIVMAGRDAVARRRPYAFFLCPKGHEEEAIRDLLPRFCRECGEMMGQVPPRECRNRHRVDRWQNFCHRCGARVPSLQERENAITVAAAGLGRD